MITTPEPALSDSELSITIARVAQRSESALRETSRKIAAIESDIATENERRQAILSKQQERVFALRQAEEGCRDAQARANSAANYAKFAAGTPGAKPADATARELEKAHSALLRNLERLGEQDREAATKEGRQLAEIDSRLSDASATLATLRNQEVEISHVHAKAITDLGVARMSAIEAEVEVRFKSVQAARQEASERHAAFEQWLIAACAQLADWPDLQRQVYATHSLAFHDSFTTMLESLVSFLSQLIDGAVTGRLVEVERIGGTIEPWFSLADLLVVEYTPLSQTLAGKPHAHLIEKRDRLERLRAAYCAAKLG